MNSEPFKITYSLKTKYILGISALVALIITLTSVLSSIREENLLTQSMDQSGILLSTTLALACQDPIIRQAYDELRQYTEGIIARGGDINEVAILDQDGKYLAHRVRGSAGDKLGQVLSKEEQEFYINNLKEPRSHICGDCMEYISPIRVGSSLLGVVILRYSFARLAEAKRSSRKHILLVGMIAMLAGVLLSVVLAHFITSGIEVLAKGTQTIAAGDLSCRIAVSTQDEIGMLAMNFNNMVENLAKQRKLIERKIFEIETLFKASQAMNFQSDTEKLVKQILEMAIEALSAERGSVMLAVDQGDELVTKIVHGINIPENEKKPQTETRIKSGEGVAGTVFKTGRSLIVNEGYQDPLFRSYATSASYEHSIRSLISVPLKVKERVTGVINVVNSSSVEGFNADDQRLLEALAHQAAMALEHARLYELAITDGMTKLFIHRYFQARLEEEIIRARRYHSVVSLILFDIDHFKKFNDTYGHQQGDIVLIEVAKLIKRAIRDTIDIAARYGGEEFAIILPETDSDGAQLVAERLRKAVEAHEVPGQDHPLKVTISLGIATFPNHATSRPILIKKADMALYHCKKRGRNCSTVFNESMIEEA